MVLSPIAALSDDDGAASGQPVATRDLAALSDDGADEQVCRNRSAPLKRAKTGGKVPIECGRPKLAKLIQSVCKCARTLKRPTTGCFQQFGGQLDDLVRLNARLRKLHKEDMDEQASLMKIKPV